MEAKPEILLVDAVAGPVLVCISRACTIIQSVHITVTYLNNREHTKRVNAMFDLSCLPGNMCFSSCQHTISSAIRALSHRDKLIEKTDSDCGRVKSKKRTYKGNDTGCGLYQMHGCIMANLPFHEIVASQSKYRIIAIMQIYSIVFWK